MVVLFAQLLWRKSCYNFGSSSTCNWKHLSKSKRSATGFDANRLTMLLALLEKKIDLPLNNYDVFINISGGIKLKSSADLACNCCNSIL